MSKNLSELSGRKGIKQSLFMKMGDASDATGTPSKEDLHTLAKEYLMGDAQTYGAITAYDFMKPDNQNKLIYVCNGSACLCAGTQGSVHERINEYFEADQIGHMTCLGRCHENSAFHYQGRNYSGEDIDRMVGIMAQTQNESEDHYTVYSETEVLTAPQDDLHSMKLFLQEMLSQERSQVLQAIKDSGIRGRGGAGFPMGIKWEGCMNQESDEKYIICNADEGDPGAYSDRFLLEKRPQNVLFGMLMAGYVTGARWGILYIRAEYPESVHIVQNTVHAWREAGMIGKGILGSDFSFDFKVVKARGAYICGEETALINSLEGQRPEVRTRPPYPTQQGLFNKPTVVNNVETLAAVYWILKNGGDTYSLLGTDKSTGTKLICLDGAVQRPGIYEVEMGVPLSLVIEDFAGGFIKPIKALHIGGPLGGIVPTHKIKDLTVDFESFSKEEFLLGHASVVSIPEDFPMIKYLEHLFDFASFESCGKCFPCRLGTRRGYELLRDSHVENDAIDRDLFEELLDTLQNGSLCAHGGGIPLPARNALHYFSDELSPYFT